MTPHADPLWVSRLALALIEELPDRRGNGAAGAVVLVTSALPGEGKSFVAGLLAARAVEDGAGDVCLVRTGGVSADAGFTDLLAGEPVIEPASAASPGSPPRPVLHEMAAGRRAQGASLFHPAGVARALAALRQRFGLCLIDGPSVGLCGALPRQVDRVLVVVDSRRTAPSVVRHGLAQAGIDVAVPASVVLNHAPQRAASWLDGR